MADGPPDDTADELTPEQETVRRLLADARHSGPMPDDVVDRLDRVLAGLSAGSSDTALRPSRTPVVELASRRRRRATTLLVAAAAVVAVGVGLGQVMDGTGVLGNNASSSDSAGDSRPQAEDSQLLDSPKTGSGASRPQQDGDAAASTLRRSVRIRAEHFSSDVRRTQGRIPALAQARKSSANLDAVGGGLVDCVPDHWGEGTFVAVRYAGDRGILVFRAPTGDTQVVELFQCGSPEVLRSITLPAP